MENERAREEVENERARAQKENERARQAQDQRLKAAIYQTSILESQGKMLRQQELIAFRTKRDNAVMKVIAVLTALFLPGTFIAVGDLPNLGYFTDWTSRLFSAFPSLIGSKRTRLALTLGHIGSLRHPLR